MRRAGRCFRHGDESATLAAHGEVHAHALPGRAAAVKAPRSNPAHYSKWHDYFRKHQPPTLIAWGKNDAIFPPAGAEPYKKDLQTVEYHLLDTGHFALEEDGDRIAGLMRQFLRKHVAAR